MNQFDDTSEIDLRLVFDDRRWIIFGPFLTLGFVSMFANWWDRDTLTGLGPGGWVSIDLAVVPMIVAVAVAGVARGAPLQWAAAAAMTGLNVYWFAQFAIPGA